METVIFSSSELTFQTASMASTLKCEKEHILEHTGMRTKEKLSEVLELEAEKMNAAPVLFKEITLPQELICLHGPLNKTGSPVLPGLGKLHDRAL